MVLATDLAGTAGFAYAAWNVLGSLSRYMSSANKRFDDGMVVNWHASLLAELVQAGERGDASMGCDPREHPPPPRGPHAGCCSLLAQGLSAGIRAAAARPPAALHHHAPRLHASPSPLPPPPPPAQASATSSSTGRR